MIEKLSLCLPYQVFENYVFIVGLLNRNSVFRRGSEDRLAGANVFCEVRLSLVMSGVISPQGV